LLACLQASSEVPSDSIGPPVATVAALDSLVALARDNPDAFRRLAGSLRADSSEIRTAAAARLATLDAPGRQALEAALGAESAGARAAAAYGLGLLGKRAEGAMGPLLRTLGERDDSAAAMASWALHQIGGRRLGRPVVVLEALRFGTPADQADALVTIASLGPDAVAFVPILTRLLTGPNASLGRLAGDALIRIGPLAQPAVEAAARTAPASSLPELHRVLAALRPRL